MFTKPSASEVILDTRRAIRYESLPETTCSVNLPVMGKSGQGWIVNLSQTGIAVLLEHHFPVAAVLRLKLENEAHQYERWMTAEVRHSEICYPNETWLHGCEFWEPLSEKELTLLVVK